MTGGLKKSDGKTAWCGGKKRLVKVPEGSKIEPLEVVLGPGGRDFHTYCSNCIDSLQFEDWMTQAEFAFIPEVAKHIVEPHLKQRKLRIDGVVIGHD